MKYDIAIIGGGILGLAGAMKISQGRPDLRVIVVEKEAELATHQSQNNSGVIHSGIYYKPGSLKAQNCILGRQALIEFCNSHGIKYELCGKLIVATGQNQLPALERLYQRGLANGLLGIKKIKQAEIKNYEPHAQGLAGIFVPQTGIVNFREVAQTLAGVFQSRGGEVALGQKVSGIARREGFSQVLAADQNFAARLIINCAGLYADKIAGFNRPNLDVRIIPFRGEYYKLKPDKKYLIKNLLYPLPDPNFPFLGVHFTRGIGGEVEAGPNAVLAFRREGYKFWDFHPGEFLETLLWPGMRKVALKNFKTAAGEVYRSLSKRAFCRELQKLVPGILEHDLTEGGAGVRAQACGKNGELLDDFLILEDAYQIDVLNAPSPAATACLAIGEKLANMALSRF